MYSAPITSFSGTGLVGAASLFFALAGVPDRAEAALCVPTALGLQSYASAEYNGGDCLIGMDRHTPIVNAVSSQYATAYAKTLYGVNSASVTGIMPVGGTGAGYINASAWSIWKDTITISGGTGTGTVSFGTHVTGTYTDWTTMFFTMAVNDGAGGNFISTGHHFGVNPNPGGTASMAEDAVLSYVFTYNVPFTLTAWLDVSGFINSRCCGGTEAQPFFSADFSHTALLDSVILPGDAILDSASGSSYPVPMQSVPEPSTLALFGAGLLAARVRLRRKTKA
jgi:PEP-CTERM motif